MILPQVTDRKYRQHRFSFSQQDKTMCVFLVDQTLPSDAVWIEGILYPHPVSKLSTHIHTPMQTTLTTFMHNLNPSVKAIHPISTAPPTPAIQC